MKDEEKRTNHELAIKLLAEQNFPAAMIAGADATVLAAAAFGEVAATASRPCFGLVDTFNVRIMRQKVFHDEEAVAQAFPSILSAFEPKPTVAVPPTTGARRNG